MFLCSTVCRVPMRKFCHDTMRPLSCCTFVECSSCRHSQVDCPRIHGPSGYLRPKAHSKRIKFSFSSQKIIEKFLPSFSPVQCLSIYPWTPNERTINERQGHDVFPSILSKSKCHMSQTPIADYEHHTQNISAHKRNTKMNYVSFTLHDFHIDQRM